MFRDSNASWLAHVRGNPVGLSSLVVGCGNLVRKTPRFIQVYLKHLAIKWTEIYIFVNFRKIYLYANRFFFFIGRIYFAARNLQQNPIWDVLFVPNVKVPEESSSLTRNTVKELPSFVPRISLNDMATSRVSLRYDILTCSRDLGSQWCKHSSNAEGLW